MYVSVCVLGGLHLGESRGYLWSTRVLLIWTLCALVWLIEQMAGEKRGLADREKGSFSVIISLV